MISILTGTEFYYADRNLGKPVKSVVLYAELSYPPKILAKREDTGKTFYCYDGFGCYPLEEYDEAVKDAQIQEDRIIY